MFRIYLKYIKNEEKKKIDFRDTIWIPNWCIVNVSFELD